MNARLGVLTLALGLALGIAGSAHAADKKPNLIMIMVDDIGCEGCEDGDRVSADVERGELQPRCREGADREGSSPA